MLFVAYLFCFFLIAILFLLWSLDTVIGEHVGVTSFPIFGSR